MASLRTDVDNLIEMKWTEPESVTFEQAEDTILGALFTAPTEPPPDPCGRSKRHQSRRTSEREDAHARKKEQTDLEAARRASLIDEETRHMRAQEIFAGESSSIPETSERSTTDGAEIALGTTEGGPTTNVAGFENPDSPTC